jgi:hypothetical protein
MGRIRERLRRLAFLLLLAIRVLSDFFGEAKPCVFVCVAGEREREERERDEFTQILKK